MCAVLCCFCRSRVFALFELLVLYVRVVCVVVFIYVCLFSVVFVLRLFWAFVILPVVLFDLGVFVVVFCCFM